MERPGLLEGRAARDASTPHATGAEYGSRSQTRFCPSVQHAPGQDDQVRAKERSLEVGLHRLPTSNPLTRDGK